MDWIEYGEELLAKYDDGNGKPVRCEVVFKKSAADARIEAAIDEVCERLAKQIFDSGMITKARQQIRSANMPNTLSPSEEAAKLLKEYAADKARRATDAESIHKFNASAELRRDHYSRLMKMVAEHDAREIAKSRGDVPAYLGPEWLKDGMVIDWNSPEDASRAVRAERLAKSKGEVPKVVHAQPSSDTDTDSDDESVAEKIARYMKAGLNWDQAATKAIQGPANAQERFATTAETNLNGGSPRQVVSNSRINPRPLSP
jgi:hypothetical protein